MDGKKQKLLIEYLLSSTDTFAICQGIVKPEYFDPEFQRSVKFIKEYYDKYNTTPDEQQIEAETNIVFGSHPITKDQIEYTTSEIEAFCQRKAIERAVLASPALIAEGKYETVRKSVTDAVHISLHRNLGLRYFDSPEERLNRMMQHDPVEPTGWDELDYLLFGGIARKELLLVSANSGGGKSLTLANLGYNFVIRGLNVLYISLELAQDIVAQRYDTMFSGISRRDWQSHTSEIITKLKISKEGSGELDIVQMKSGTKASQIEAFLKEYHLHYNMMPDLLILDYLDKMHPNETVNLGDVWTKDKLVSEQLRDIGVAYDMFIATASQLNREAVKAVQHDHSHIAGGISKINEADVYWSIIMSETMKAAGQIAFTLQKTRNSDGVGKTIYLKWDGTHLRITNDDKSDHGLTFKKKSNTITDEISESSDSKNKLLDLLSSTAN